MTAGVLGRSLLTSAAGGSYPGQITGCVSQVAKRLRSKGCAAVWRRGKVGRLLLQDGQVCLCMASMSACCMLLVALPALPDITRCLLHVCRLWSARRAGVVTAVFAQQHSTQGTTLAYMYVQARAELSPGRAVPGGMRACTAASSSSSWLSDSSQARVHWEEGHSHSRLAWLRQVLRPGQHSQHTQDRWHIACTPPRIQAVWIWGPVDGEECTAGRLCLRRF